MRKFLIALAAVAALTPAFAQDAASGRAVTMVVPFAAGASNDVMARFLARGLAKKWGRPVVVEIKAGAGGAIGTAHVSRSAPDGHTLLFTSSAYTTLVASAPLRERGFEPSSLLPAAMVAQGQYVLVVGPTIKARNFAEFVAEAKARPLFAGTSGINGGAHLAAEALASAIGFNMEPVHYKGGSEAILDTAAGRTDFQLGSVSLNYPFIKEGKIRPLAIMNGERSPLLPDVPSIYEVGYKDAEFSAWWGVFVPARTPAAFVESLHADINAVMGTDEARKFLEGLGTSPSIMTSAQFRTQVTDETRRWSLLVNKMKPAGK